MAPAGRKRKAPKPSSTEALQSTSKHDKSSSAESSAQSTNSITQPTPTGINRLPFDCLLATFRRIPLKTLISIRRVSRTWNSTVVYICARKERLTLAVYTRYAWDKSLVSYSKNESDLFWIEDLSRYVLDRTENPHESVHFPIGQLTKQSTVCLAQLFPSLTELRIHYDCNEIVQSYLAKIEFLVRLFSSSSSNLRVFSLNFASKYCYNKTVDMHDVLRKIASNITASRLPHLKQLDLCIDGHFSRYLPLYTTLDFQAKKYVDMLSKLTRVSLGYDSTCYDNKSTLAKLGTGLVSLNLSLTRKIDAYAPLITIDMFDNVKFVTSLTHLGLRFLHDRKREESNLNFIRALCERFQALQSVQLQIVAPQPRPDDNGAIDKRPNFDDQWIRPLATLQHLSRLRLHDFDVALC